MSGRARLLMAAGIVLPALLGAWWAMSSGTSPIDSGAQGPEVSGAGQAAAPATSRASGEDGRELPRTQVGEPPARPGGAALLVKALWAAGAPAAGIGICARQAQGPPLGRWGTTGLDGRLLLEDLSAGWVAIQTDRPAPVESIVLAAGETREATITIRDGIELRGLVVDSKGMPVPGAQILLSQRRMLPQLTFVAAESGKDGTFVLEALDDTSIVGARARGRGTSTFAHVPKVSQQAGEVAKLTLVLPDAAAALAGVVLGLRGETLAGALVRVGTIEMTLVKGVAGVAQSTLPIHLTTDAEGRFAAGELAPGPEKVHAYAPGCAPLDATCELVAGKTLEVTLRLRAPATLSGTISDHNGVPAPSILLEIGDFDYPEPRSVKTGNDGKYRITDLRAGPTSIRVGEEQRGIARAEVVLAEGTETRWSWRLPPGLVMCGRLVDHDGRPLSGWWIRLEDQDRPEVHPPEVATGDQGTFLIPEIEDSVYRLRVYEQPPPAPPVFLTADLRSGDHRVVVPQRARARGILKGNAVLPDGRPAAGAEVRVLRGELVIGAPAKCAPDGSFATAPLLPGAYDLRVVLLGFEPLVVRGVEVAAGEGALPRELRFVR